MRSDRRKFVKSMGLAAGSMLMLPACSVFAGGRGGKGIGIRHFGLQLYTLRDDMPKDPRGILKKVAEAGYKQVESYEGPQGMWWGMGHKGFRQYVNDLGMEVVASHCNIFEDFEKKAAEAAEIGMKYLICPWLGPQEDLEKFKKAAEDFNRKGALCKRNGIRFAYHNHAYSFKKMQDIYPQDVMMEIADSDLVDFELDMYWVHAAGENIEHWLNKYKGRFRLCHIKDYSKNPGKDDGKNSVNLGQGVIDWRKVLTTARSTGMEYYFIEQEAYEGTTPLDAIRANAGYMKELLTDGQ